MSSTILAILVLLAIGLMGLRIANQYQRAVIFRLGRYMRTRGPGLYWIIPLIEWQQTVDLRINTTAVEQQETITKDNVPIKVNAVVWYRVVDPKLSVIEVKNIDLAVIQVALTTLRTNWEEVKGRLITRIDADYGVYEGSTFKTRRFAHWLAARGMAWPRLPSGALALDDDTFRDRAMGREGRTRGNEECRDSRIDAARHGAGGGSAA